MSAVRNKKTFALGIALLISFAVIFMGMMSPNFGNGRNGLEYADDLFNSLSKGSAYLIKEAQEVAETQNGKNINFTVAASSPEVAEKWGKLYTTAGASATVQESSVTIDGDLGKILAAAVADSDFMYHNDAKSVEAKYGFDGIEATYYWNTSLKEIENALKDESQFQEASALLKVQQRAVEPGYNYYGIEIKKVSENLYSLVFLLVFYLIYTIWYGFGLFYLSDGLGIVVGKSKKTA